jgi:hypothetical protein
MPQQLYNLTIINLSQQQVNKIYLYSLDQLVVKETHAPTHTLINTHRHLQTIDKKHTNKK